MVRYQRQKFASAAEANAFAPLSPKEVEVAKLIAADMYDTEIAEALGLACNTIHARIKCILRKLRSLPPEDFPYRIRTRVGVAVWYLQAASQ